MQTTIYYRKDDQYLIDKLEELARRQRKSKSACLLSILEEYFESDNRLGEILSDIGVISQENLRRALDKQNEKENSKKIGEIMLEEGYIEELDLDRALEIQKN